MEKLNNKTINSQETFFINSDKYSRLVKITQNSSSRLRDSYIMKHDIELYDEIMSYTNHLNCPFIQRVYHWCYDVVENVKCICGKDVKFNKNWLDGYKRGCSIKCTSKDPSVLEKRKKTVKDKYGVDNVAKSNDVKKKIEETNIERYGTKSTFQNEQVREKWRKNIKEKYDVDHVFQLENVKKEITKTNKEKYGVDYYTQSNDYKSKVIETNQQNYGVDHYMSTDDFKEKSKKTVLEKYGTEYYTQSEEYQSNIKKFNLENYGVENYVQSDDFKEKAKETILNRYGVDHRTKDENFRKNFKIANDANYIKYISNQVSQFNCDCGKDHSYEITTNLYYNRKRRGVPTCLVCYPINDHRSIKENLLYKYIKSIYDGEVISCHRDGLEIDIYLPELNIGFEFNGLYWHSEKFLDDSYHLDKKNYFKEKGINIIHIWEDDWDHRQDIIKSRIKYLLGKITNKIDSSDCKVFEVLDSNIVREFLDKNNIYGYCSSSKNIGLYHNGELVSLLCIENDIIVRYSCLLDTIVIDGFSKLLSFYINKYNPIIIMFNVNNDIFSGKSLLNFGFKIISTEMPNYRLFDNDDNSKVYDCGKNKLLYRCV